MITLLRHGCVSLRRTQVLWLGIVLTLALALAATVVVFNLVNAYLIRPLPYGDTSRLAVIYEYSLKTGRDRSFSRTTSGNVVELRERLKSFARIATIFNASVTVHAGAPDPEVIAAAKAVENVRKHLEGKTIVKEIVVPKRLVNFVVR